MLLSIKVVDPWKCWMSKWVSSIVSYLITSWYAQSLHNGVYLLNYQPYKIKMCSSLCWGVFHSKLHLWILWGEKNILRLYVFTLAFPPPCLSRSWSPSSCAQPVCTPSPRRGTSFSILFDDQEARRRAEVTMAASLGNQHSAALLFIALVSGLPF